MTIDVPKPLDKTTVPLRTGPPTREELLVHYPAKFTWEQLKTFVNSGDLGLLKRDIALQKRYDEWAVGLVEKYGTVVNYLLNYRLQWGKPDTLSLLPSVLDKVTAATKEEKDPAGVLDPKVPRQLPPLPPDAPAYFTSDTPPEYLSIIQNDWPYSGKLYTSFFNYG
ncbi:hypothetical protein AX16_007984 [Volvariella volvacea WC 439]|nr:hypothetical protein AX16_007984 [Volvariella volvacea WC 439]